MGYPSTARNVVALDEYRAGMTAERNWFAAPAGPPATEGAVLAVRAPTGPEPLAEDEFDTELALPRSRFVIWLASHRGLSAGLTFGGLALGIAAVSALRSSDPAPALEVSIASGLQPTPPTSPQGPTGVGPGAAPPAIESSAAPAPAPVVAASAEPSTAPTHFAVPAPKPRRKKMAGRVRRFSFRVPQAAASRSVDAAERLEKAWLAMELGNFGTALRNYQAAAKADPAGADAHFGVAIANLELHRDDAARKALARTLAADPRHGLGNVLAGFLAQMSGDRKTARVHYERCLKFQPDGPLSVEVQSVLESL